MDIRHAMTPFCQEAALNGLAEICHNANLKWWLDLEHRCTDCGGHGHYLSTGTVCITCKGLGYPLKDRNVGEMLMLCVSELAEAMEGHRKNLPDDKLPHRSMLEVELADCLIRIFDLAIPLKLDLGGAFVEKMEYNRTRADHSIAGRLASGGKKY